MFYDGRSVGNRTFDATTDETSGITRSVRAENAQRQILWHCVDGANFKIWAISGVNGSSLGAWTLTGAGVASGGGAGDMEDLGSAIVNGVPYIYLGAIGNNANAANACGTGVDVAIFRVVEPVVTGSDGSTTNFIRIDCVFPAGNLPVHKDCEAMFVDPLTGTIYIITKRDSTAKLYSLPHAATYSGIQTLNFVGNITTPATITQSFTGSNGGYYVGADISVDGREILLKSYADVYLWQIQDRGKTTIGTALAGAAATINGYVGCGKAASSGAQPASFPQNEPQGEGICFDWTGAAFYTVSEGGDASSVASTKLTNALEAFPLFKYDRVPAAVTEYTFQHGVNSYTGGSNTYIDKGNPTSNFGSATTFIVADRDADATCRLGLLAFDLTSLAGKKVVGADLYVYINTSGEDFALHRMLIAWSEATSTWNNLNGGSGLPRDGLVAAATASASHGAPNNAQLNHGYNSVVNQFVRIKLPISDVQAMIDSPSTNYGWMWHNYTSQDGLQFRSNDHATTAHRPQLIVRAQ